MSGIAVRQILDLPELSRLELLAGASGLDRVVGNVTVLEVPQVARWLRDGDMVLTTFYAAQYRPGGQLELFEELLAGGVSALGYHPAEGKIPLDPAVLRRAGEAGIPVIRIPPDMPYATIITSVLRAILNRQAYLLHRSVEINSTFTRVVLAGADTTAVLQVLANQVRSPVLMVDGGFFPVASEPYNAAGSKALRGHESEAAEGLRRLWEGVEAGSDPRQEDSPVVSEVSVGARQFPVAAQRVPVGDTVFGYLSVWGVQKSLDEVDLIALNHAVTSLALGLVRKSAAAQQRTRMIQELVEDVLSGGLGSERAIRRRAASLGVDLSDKTLVVVVDIDNFEEYYLSNARRGEEHVQNLRSELLAAVERVLEELLPGSLAVIKSDSVVVLTRCPSATWRGRVLKAAHAVHASVKARLAEVTCSVGVGNPHGSPLELAMSYHEAKLALDIGRRVKGPNRVTVFEDLGVYRFLASTCSSHEAEKYCLVTLGNLASRAGYTGDLLDTVEAYLESGRSIAETAKRTFVHPNTVKYRLQRAREFLPAGALEGDRWLDVLLAIKMYRLLRGAAQRPEPEAAPKSVGPEPERGGGSGSVA
ncbi:MAG: PucR family transcriptional regulator ligand-binding domain-containing protein [Bacillota bacterium]